MHSLVVRQGDCTHRRFALGSMERLLLAEWWDPTVVPRKRDLNDTAIAKEGFLNS